MLRPLKKAGFQKNKGVIPHFKNIENTKKNQLIPNDNIDSLETLLTK
jgi:hypothetical protein